MNGSPNIVRTEEYLKSKGYITQTNVIDKIDIQIIPHFNSIPCLAIMCHDIIPYCSYNNIRSLGCILQTLTNLFDDYVSEDGIWLSEFTKVPCRLVLERVFKRSDKEDGWNFHCIGIGHFTKDRFVFFDDFRRLKCE